MHLFIKFYQCFFNLDSLNNLELYVESVSSDMLSSDANFAPAYTIHRFIKTVIDLNHVLIYSFIF